MLDIPSESRDVHRITKSMLEDLPRALQSIILSMLTGRESIDVWMAINNMTDRHDARVIDELRRRHGCVVVRPDELVCISSSSMMPQLDLPNWVKVVTLIYPWVESIADNWLRCLPALRHVTFADVSSLQTVGNRWLSECQSLVSVDFRGMPALRTVGRGWMSNSPSLVAVDFSGLFSLMHVDIFWMYDCPRLASPDFRGLSSIATIGHLWMHQCPSLVSPLFHTRIRVRVVVDEDTDIVDGLRLLYIGRTLFQY